MKIIPADERRRMGDVVRKADTGVGRYGTRATVLNRKASAREEGSGYPSLLRPDQRVGRKEACEVWLDEEGDREWIP